MVGSLVFWGCFGFYRVRFRSQNSKNAHLGSGCRNKSAAVLILGTAALGNPSQAQKSGQNAATSGQTSAAALLLGAAAL